LEDQYCGGLSFFQTIKNYLERKTVIRECVENNEFLVVEGVHKVVVLLCNGSKWNIQKSLLLSNDRRAG
jgi:hypothetical protein